VYVQWKERDRVQKQRERWCVGGLMIDEGGAEGALIVALLQRSVFRVVGVGVV
jgi:hypothetical protein